MSLEYLIEQYGYLALFIGTLLEGETIMLIAGFAAHQSYLNIHLVILLGFAGTFISDQIFFFIGRFNGQRFLEKRSSWQNKFTRIEKQFQQHQNLLILTFRFIYGLRTVTPFFIGMSRISIIRFMFLNLIGAAVWAILIGYLGFYSGHTMAYLLHNIKHLEKLIMLIISLIGISVWSYHVYIRHRNNRRNSKK